MNIKITHNWLLEYLDTDATPDEIQQYLSLCGPSIERVYKNNDDLIYEVEVTSNRIDTASVIGVAREAAAILPRFGKRAELKNMDFKAPDYKKNNLSLDIKDKEKLTNRILAVIIDGVHFGKSPKYIRERLEAAGIRSLNNLVDITNYVMIEIGHPTHVFDYDRIQTGTFVFRSGKKGEKLVTLDQKSFDLKGGEVVIDDGSGRIVDLPSIMGTMNSIVTPQTKRVIFFIDNVDPVLIRKASMAHGIRTLAATYNEKSPDPQLGKLALLRGIKLFTENTQPNSLSEIIDIYAKPKKAKRIILTSDFIRERIGVAIPEKEILSILQDLEFEVYSRKGNLEVIAPSYRIQDVEIPEDIIEEVARIYGYFKLPSNVQPAMYVKQPSDIGLFLKLQSGIKRYLKDIGLHEVMNYSMISEKLIKSAGLNVKDNLVLKNAISKDFKYMRTHLLPSLLQNIKQNEGKRDVLKFFEIAKTYKKSVDALPEGKYKLGIAVNTDISDLKGIIDALMDELHIRDFEIRKTEYDYFAKHTQAEIRKDNEYIVRFGELASLHKERYGIKGKVFSALFDLQALIKHTRPIGIFKPVNPFAEVKLDLTIESDPKKPFIEIQKKALVTSPFLQKLELIDTFRNKITLRFYFSSYERNITEEEAKKELENVKKNIL